MATKNLGLSEVVLLPQIKQSAPQQNGKGISASTSSATYTTSVTITAPCAGYVIGFGRMAQGGVNPTNLTIYLTVGTTDFFAESNPIAVTGCMGFEYLDKGESVKVTMTGTGIFSVAAVLRVFAFFLPAPSI